MRYFTRLLAMTGIGLMSMYGPAAHTAEPALSSIQDLRSAGTVQLVNSQQRTVVIDDREYVVSDASVKKLVRGTRVNFSYRESRPLPIISDISAQR